MRPLSFRKRLAPLALVALALAFLVGCGQAPNAPIVSQQAAAVQVHQTAETNSLIGGLVSVVGDVVNLVVRVLNLVGSLGGSLTNGRWRVDVPAGAVDGDATVTLGVPTTTSDNCQLEILPTTKNHFATPARLTVTCPGVPSSALSNYTIFWLDPATRKWVPVESTVDLNAKTVSAPLQHFSTYCVGSKASW
jgi:hypothetical protein